MPVLLREINQNGERYLLLVFYTLIVTVIGVEVSRRFVLSYSSLWGEEIARYSLIYLVWIGASHAVRMRTHIRVDLIFGFVPDRHHIWLHVLGDVTTMLFAVIAFYLSIHPIVSSIEFGSVTEGLRVSRVIALIALPLGFAMTLLRLVQNLVRDLHDHAGGRPIYAGKKLFE